MVGPAAEVCPRPRADVPHPRALARYTEIYFAENQLSPGLIGLSPLATAPPRILQHPRVRPLGKARGLAMASSPGFGSNPANSGGYLRLPRLSSLAGLTCWPIMQKVRCR